MAFEKGKQLDLNNDQSIAYGSSIARTQETAAILLLSKNGDIPIESLEEMEKELSNDLRVGKRVGVDKRLVFNVGGPIREDIINAAMSGKYISFLINESDKLAIDKGDKFSTTYLRQAGNIAGIIRKYSQISENFYKIKQQEDKKELTNKLERYFVTHQSICETFIAKCLEIVKGNITRDEFVEKVGDGFKELEGMSIKITDNREGKNIVITYPFNGKQESLVVDDKLLQNIIDERLEYEKNFN